MSPNRDFEDGHHKPRDHKNKKRRKGFTEDKGDRRAQRIGFKNYLRELQEQDLDDNLDGDFESSDTGV